MEDANKDLVEVVRCDECVSLDVGANESCCWYDCKIFKREVYPSFYCGYGERRKDNEDS